MKCYEIIILLFIVKGMKGSTTTLMFFLFITFKIKIEVSPNIGLDTRPLETIAANCVDDEFCGVQPLNKNSN